MKLSSIPIKNEQYYYQKVKNDGFLINSSIGKIKVVNPTGAQVWELIDGHNSIHDIARIMESMFDTTIDELYSDLIKFLQALFERSLIYLKQE